MADRSSNVLSDLADRQSAVRVLGAASTAVLVALGLGVTGEARDRKSPGEGKGKSGRNQRTRHTGLTEGGNRPADRDNPAEPVDDAAVTEPVKNALVAARQTKRRFVSKKVEGDPSAPLAATDGALVFSRAFCPGGDGKLLSGGHGIDGTPAQLVNVVVGESGPDEGAGSFAAVLRSSSGSGSTAGATIQALAICKA